MPGIDDRALRRAVSVDVGGADQKARDFLNWLLRSRQPNANERIFDDPCVPKSDQGLQSFDRQRQMRTTLVVYHRVNLIDDERARGL